MNPEILLIAAPHEEWPQHVKALTAGRLVALQLDPNAPLATDTRLESCLLYTSPSPRDRQKSRMPSSA